MLEISAMLEACRIVRQLYPSRLEAQHRAQRLSKQGARKRDNWGPGGKGVGGLPLVTEVGANRLALGCCVPFSDVLSRSIWKVSDRVFHQLSWCCPAPFSARSLRLLRASCLPPTSGSGPCSLVLGRSGLRASLRAAPSRAVGEAVSDGGVNESGLVGERC